MFLPKKERSEGKMADGEQPKDPVTPPLTREDIPEIVKAVVTALTRAPWIQVSPIGIKRTHVGGRRLPWLVSVPKASKKKKKASPI